MRSKIKYRKYRRMENLKNKIALIIISFNIILWKNNKYLNIFKSFIWIYVLIE